jgi:hypothetical protein
MMLKERLSYDLSFLKNNFLELRKNESKEFKNKNITPQATRRVITKCHELGKFPIRNVVSISGLSFNF